MSWWRGSLLLSRPGVQWHVHLHMVIFDAVCVRYFQKFCAHSEQGEQTGRAVHEDGLGETFVGQQEEMGGHRRSITATRPQLHSACVPGLRDPGVVHRRGHRGGDGVGADVADDGQRLLQGVVHAQHLVPPLRLVS